jgi:hypothetical protein
MILQRRNLIPKSQASPMILQRRNLIPKTAIKNREKVYTYKLPMTAIKNREHNLHQINKKTQARVPDDQINTSTCTKSN